MKKKDNLVWMDLEFTGLSDDQIIIETACIITDKNLNNHTHELILLLDLV